MKTTMRVTENIRYAFSNGRHFMRNHMAIYNAMLSAIPASLPNYRRQYYIGYADALMATLNNEVQFRYQLPDGRWINAFDLEYDSKCVQFDTCEHTGHIVARSRCPSGFFWIGTDSPYSGDGVKG